VGYDMSQRAAEKCFKAAGLKPGDVDVVELHDCFSANELITYEALGLCEEGKPWTSTHLLQLVVENEYLFYQPSPI
ncbi:sterol carrier protein 2, partial [Goodea atripinnis]